jgi:ribosomal-protein-alanine N-acetyltransferase
MLSGLSVRPVKTADLDPVLAIEHASFGRDSYDRNLFAEFAARSRQLTRRCGGLFLVANKGSKVLGYSITCIRGNGAELVSIAVHPQHRGRGPAAALMDSTLRRLSRRGVARFVLMVKVTNHRALAFYEKYGFRKIRRVPRYYEDGADAFLFVKLL